MIRRKGEKRKISPEDDKAPYKVYHECTGGARILFIFSTNFTGFFQLPGSASLFGRKKARNKLLFFFPCVILGCIKYTPGGTKMDLQTGMKLHGFTVTRIRPIPGTSAQLVEMLYEKTRTELVWYRTNESNKLFNVIFKTLPRDSTGVFHILEHSLLCGSAKFPLKEPFVELMKSTMSTFINAITFPDKTMYPVGSRNEQDFLNLTQVYLDAAFAPRAMEDPKIFRQEGWHHEIDGDTLSYNGVVFNEMKGAMSSLDDVVYEGLNALLFPDTSYGFNSGGDPRVIPELTYEHYCASYHEHYHPSNARIYLDGSIPLEKTLALIDSYLSKFDLSTRRKETYQQPRAASVAVPFEIGPDEDPREKYQLVLGKILGTWDQKDRLLAAQALCQVLCGANSSPLKRAILDEGLAQDVTMEVLDGMAQNVFFLRVHNHKKENTARIREVVTATVRDLTEKGLDRQELTAAINHLAFRCKDIDDPQAVYRSINALNAWLYEGDPMTYLTFDESIENLRALAENGGFEQLLKEMLLDDSDLCVLSAEPSADYGTRTREEERQRLAADRAAMTEADLAALAAENDILHAWQQTPDTPEELAKLPVLSLDQISPEPQILDTAETDVAGVPVLFHEAQTGGVVHLSGYFSLTDRSYDELPAIRFLASLLGKLPTDHYDAAALNNQIKTWLGSLQFSVSVFGSEKDPDTCTPCFQVSCKVLKENLPQARELLEEILLHTHVDSPDAIREVLLQEISDALPGIIGSGHDFSALCAQAHFSARNAAAEAVGGYTRIRWMKDLEAEFASRIGSCIGLYRSVLAETFCTSRMTLSITGSQPEELSGLISAFPRGSAVPKSAGYQTTLPRKLGIRLPAQVSYACMGYRLNRCGQAYQGSILLAANILSLSCLWNSIRVQGGAYGAGMNADRSGSLYCYSYRDPSPGRTLDVYRQLAGFLRSFPESGESLVKYIISTVASTEPLMKPNRLAAEADRTWFSGITREDLLRERQELLSADFDSLLSWCPMLEAMAGDGCICVLGHDAALAQCEKENLTIYNL